MNLREFEIIFQVQYFKGNNFICIRTLMLLFDKNFLEEESSNCLHGAKFGRGRIWFLLTGVCF